jgi:hypothetical protein
VSKIKVGIVIYYVPYNTVVYERDFGLVTEIIDCNFEVTSLKNGLGDERIFPLKYLGKKIFLNKATADKVAEQRTNH